MCNRAALFIYEERDWSDRREERVLFGKNKWGILSSMESVD